MTKLDFLIKRVLADAKKDLPAPITINPFNGGLWCRRDDPISLQVRRAKRAILAQEKFEHERPRDAPNLPTTYLEREDLKNTGRPLDYLVALYSYSWSVQGYEEHPSFDAFAAGCLASNMLGAPCFNNTSMREMSQRWPPATLEGLGGGCRWSPPGQRRSRR